MSSKTFTVDLNGMSYTNQDELGYEVDLSCLIANRLSQLGFKTQIGNYPHLNSLDKIHLDSIILPLGNGIPSTANVVVTRIGNQNYLINFIF